MAGDPPDPSQVPPPSAEGGAGAGLTALPLPLTGPRLMLRPYEEADIPVVATYLTDMKYWEYLPADPLSGEQVGALIQWTLAEQKQPARPTYHLCAVDRTTGDIVGEGVIKGLNAAQPVAEIGWGVARAFWGRGYATEIGHMLMAAAFNTLGVHRVAAIATLDHKAAIRVLQKLAMAREGVLREHVRVRGRFWTSALYAMLAPEYRKIHAHRADRTE